MGKGLHVPDHQKVATIPGGKGNTVRVLINRESEVLTVTDMKNDIANVLDYEDDTADHHNNSEIDGYKPIMISEKDFSINEKTIWEDESEYVPEQSLNGGKYKFEIREYTIKCAYGTFVFNKKRNTSGFTFDEESGTPERDNNVNNIPIGFIDGDGKTYIFENVSIRKRKGRDEEMHLAKRIDKKQVPQGKIAELLELAKKTLSSGGIRVQYDFSSGEAPWEEINYRYKDGKWRKAEFRQNKIGFTDGKGEEAILEEDLTKELSSLPSDACVLGPDNEVIPLQSNEDKEETA